MQQIFKQPAVVDVRCGGGNRMDQLDLAVDTDMHLHAKVPLVAFSRLMHLRVAFAFFVLGRTRGIDDARIHNRTGADFQPVLMKILVDQGKQLVAQVMRLKQMTELADRGLIRCRLTSQINTYKEAHGRESYRASSTAGSDRLNQCCRK